MQSQDPTLLGEQQGQWKWCNKCQVMAMAGNSSSACAAGGAHDYSGSGEYFIGVVVGADTVLHDAYMAALKPVGSAEGAMQAMASRAAG